MAHRQRKQLLDEDGPWYDRESILLGSDQKQVQDTQLKWLCVLGWFFSKFQYLCVINGCACVHAKSLQLCPTLCNPVNCSLPGSSVYGFSRQEYWSGLPCPPPGDLPNPGIKPASLCLLHWQAGSWPLVPPGKPLPNPAQLQNPDCSQTPQPSLWALALAHSRRSVNTLKERIGIH